MSRKPGVTRRKRLLQGLAAGVIAATLIGSAATVCADTAITSLPDPRATDSDSFGAALSLSHDGSLLAVGAPLTGAQGLNQIGRAYLYRGAGLPATPAVILDDPAALDGDQFGYKVAVSGDGSLAAVSALGGVSGAARVYVFGTGNGTLLATLDDPDTGKDCFGQSLAMSADGGTVAVGASCASVDGLAAAGKTYVYTQINQLWSPIPAAVLNDPRQLANDSFGASVALSSDGATLLVGSDDAQSSDPLGRAYVFSVRAGNWQQAPVALADPSGAPGTRFGSRVALSADGSTALVGAGIGGAGKEAYVFNGNGGPWTVTAAFDAPPAHDTTGFVSSVRLSGDGRTALVGLQSDSGVVHLFVRNGNWPAEPTQTFTDPANHAGDQYGWTLALSADGSTQVVGSPSAVSRTASSADGSVTLAGPGMAYAYNPNAMSTAAPTVEAAATPASGGGGKGAYAPLLLLTLIAVLAGRLRKEQV